MGGGALIRRGRGAYLIFLILRWGANSKRGTYLNLGANSSIYGTFQTYTYFPALVNMQDPCFLTFTRVTYFTAFFSFPKACIGCKLSGAYAGQCSFTNKINDSACFLSALYVPLMNATMHAAFGF